MKAVVSVGFRPGVLDPEALAIHKALSSLGFAAVTRVSRTKVIELDLEAAERSAAELEVRRMCETLLANPVIETYKIELRD